MSLTSQFLSQFNTTDTAMAPETDFGDPYSFAGGFDNTTPPMQAPLSPQNANLFNRMLRYRQKVTDITGRIPQAEQQKRKPLEFLMDVLSTGQYMSANLAENLLGMGPKPRSLGGAADALWSGVKAGTTGQGRRGDYQDILRRGMGLMAKKYGWKGVTPEGYFNTGNQAADTGLNFARETLGSAGNILLDPLTYVTAGKGKLAQKATKLLGKGELAARGLTLMDDAGVKAAARLMAKEGLDDAIVKGIVKAGDQGSALKYLKTYADDAAKMLRADKGGIKFVLPEMTKAPGQFGKKKLHIPFFSESDYAVGKTILDTDPILRKMGVPQAMRAAVSNVSGAFRKTPQVTLHEKLIDQVRYNPEGVLSRLFVRPVKNGGKFVPHPDLADAAKLIDNYPVTKVNVTDSEILKMKSLPAFNTAYEIARTDPKVMELAEAFKSIPAEKIKGSDALKVRNIKQNWNPKVKAAREFIDTLVSKIEALNDTVGETRGMGREEIMGFIEGIYGATDDVWSQAKQFHRAGWYAGTGSGIIDDAASRLRPDLEKTLLGKWVDKTAEVLMKEYQLPDQFRNALKRYHLRDIEDRIRTDQVAEEFFYETHKAGMSDKDYYDFLRYVESGGARKMKNSNLEKFADEWRRIFREDPNIKWEIKEGLMNPRENYVPIIPTKAGEGLKNKGALTMNAQEWVDRVNAYWGHLNRIAEGKPQLRSRLEAIGQKIFQYGPDGKIEIPDGHTYARIMKSIDDAISLGKEPILDPDELIRARLHAASDLKRQDELLQALVKNPDLTIDVPQNHALLPKEKIPTPPGYVLGDDLRIPALKGKFVEEKTARYLVKHFLPKEELHPLLKAYDKALNVWKWMVTVPNPGFHTRNTMGNFITNWFANVNDPKVYWDAGKILRNGDDLKKLGSMMIDVPGGKISALDILNQAKARGIINEGGMAATEIIGALGPLKKGGRKILGKIENITRFNEDWARLAHFIDKTKKGFTYDDAAKSVNKYLFDYRNVTDFDRSAKRVVPFWTWVKNNLPLQVEQLIKQPGKYAYLPKFKGLIEGGSEKMMENRARPMPDWLRESYHVHLPDAWHDSPNPVIAKLGVPQEDPAKWMDVKEIAGSVSPFIKVPAELTFNKNLYFGSDIVPKHLLPYPEYQTVKTDPLWKYAQGIPGNPLNVKQGFDKYGNPRVEMDARSYHVLRSTTRPVSEVGKLLDSETDGFVRLMNYLGPARVYEYDPRRQQMFDLYSQIDSYRQILKKLHKNQVRGGIGRGTGR